MIPPGYHTLGAAEATEAMMAALAKAFTAISGSTLSASDSASSGSSGDAEGCSLAAASTRDAIDGGSSPRIERATLASSTTSSSSAVSESPKSPVAKSPVTKSPAATKSPLPNSNLGHVPFLSRSEGCSSPLGALIDWLRGSGLTQLTLRRQSSLHSPPPLGASHIEGGGGSLSNGSDGEISPGRIEAGADFSHVEFSPAGGLAEGGVAEDQVGRRASERLSSERMGAFVPVRSRTLYLPYHPSVYRV